MSKRLFCANIYVKKSPIHGYGVYAEQNFDKGDLIEECHVIFTQNQYKDSFEDYLFNSGDKDFLALGYGSIYNHSDVPNACLYFNYDENIAEISAVKPIKEGEEIYISYGVDWFKERQAKKKERSTRAIMRDRLKLVKRVGLKLTRAFIVMSMLYGTLHFMVRHVR